jgi:allophanate hydrolase
MLAGKVFGVARGFDLKDPYSRQPGQRKAWPARDFRFGVPSRRMLEFFGDESAPGLYDQAVARFEQLGGKAVEIDYGFFRDAAQLLYSGPWVAERLAAIREFASNHPGALHPVTASIILKAERLSAVSTFEAMYKLAELVRAAEAEWNRMDFMLLPTAGAAYTHEEVAAEPIALNTNLGHYTNFVNLMDLAALAIPAGLRANGIPVGVTLVGPAWSDEALLSTAGAFGSDSAEVPYMPEGYVPLAVCGAHLSGQPLNWQLKDAGAFLIEATRTSPRYRLYALKGTIPPKPGLVMTETGGGSIEVEVWAVPISTFGSFVSLVPAPLAIGSCTLESGRQVKSFVCEPSAIDNATDITHLGGWRNYVRDL